MLTRKTHYNKVKAGRVQTLAWRKLKYEAVKYEEETVVKF